MAPDRPDPSVKLPNSWNYQGNPAESNLPYIAWWQKFNDPDLNRIIESALKNNDSLEASKANIEQARASLLSVEMSWIPSLSALAGFFNLQPLMPQPQLIYGMYAGYNSLNIFNIIAQQKAAELGVDAAKMQYEGSKLDVIAQTASAYYTLIAQKEELRLNQENLKDLSQALHIKQNNENAGLDANEIATDAKQSYYQAQNQVKATQNKYKIYAQDVTATYTQLLPSFMLGLGPAGGTSGGMANMPSSFSSTIQMNFINWSLNPAVFGQASSYKGQEKSAYVNYIDTVHKALRDINNDLATNQITNERYQLLKQAGNSAASKYRNTYSAYKAGLKSFDDTLNAKQNLNQVQQSINQIRLAQMQAIISLYQDLGGGYRYFDESK